MTIPIRDTLGRSGVGNYPLLEDTDIRGGLRIVTNTTARDAIQSALRTEGMLVYVVADATLYRLESGQWVGLPFGHDLFFSNDATHTIQVKESVDSAGNILNVVAGKGGEYEDGGTLNLRSGDGGDEAVAGNVYIDIGDGIDIEDAYQGHAWIHIGNYKAFNINIGREVLGVPSNALTLTSSWIGLVGKSVVIGKDADSRLYLQGNLGTDIIFAEANPKVIQVKDSTTPDLAGGTLAIRSGAGNGTGNGGALGIDTGAGAAGGALSIGTANAASIALGRASSPPITLNGANPLLKVTAGELIHAGAPVIMANSSGNPRAYEGDANGTGTRRNVLGFAPAQINSSGVGTVQSTGEVAIPDARWDSVPAVTDVGMPFFLSETVGKLTIDTVGFDPASDILRLGFVTAGGTGNVKGTIVIGTAS